MTVRTTAVPPVVISDSGIDIPDTADVLSGRLTDIINALPAGAGESLTSPQGQLAVTDTAIIAQVYSNLARIINQVNPDFSQGRLQDGIGRIYFIDRIAATRTTVTAQVTGTYGTVLPAGSQAVDVNNMTYSLVNSVTIPAGGRADAIFACDTTGPVTCGAGDLNRIYTAVSGWDSVNNQYAGILGADVESRVSFEARRRESVARNSRNQDGSTRAALLEVNGVTDAYVWSNRKDESVVVDGVTIAPHSLYVSVYGGEDKDIAEALFNTCNPGCNMNGEKEFIVYDETYDKPQPQYVMQWHQSVPERVHFKVEIDKSQNPPSDITAQVKRVITEVFTGRYPNINKARIGGDVAAGRYYAPVIGIQPDSVSILSLAVSLDGASFSPSVHIPISSVPVIEDPTIEVILV
ncbi:baseplate J/gp47 family protein [Morganella morganii]|uniref:baseplate J/gp47 family protein n=1 Tax=Morganella morganii TaxID=582 RepID=UPI002367A06A|nr:baseplate J/gp47 family protein [Morganella morganii]